MDCSINGVPTSFLLDLGAAVTLLRRDTWERVTVSNPQDLGSYSAMLLVGVDGSPLTIHGRATVNLQMKGRILDSDIVVVSPVTAEAILGLDFLQEHQVQINIAKQRIYLADQGDFVPLRAPIALPTTASQVIVRCIEKCDIPACCEV